MCFTVCFAVTYSHTPAKNSSLHNWAPHKRRLGASGVQTSCTAERTASFISCHTLSSGSCAMQSATGSNLEATWGCVCPKEFWHKPAQQTGSLTWYQWTPIVEGITTRVVLSMFSGVCTICLWYFLCSRAITMQAAGTKHVCSWHQNATAR